jgi:drug/metabolite transporter (DMT)-like permease
VAALPTLSMTALLAWPVWAIVLTCGVGCTLFPVLLQCKYQPTLRAHTAALIITLEPVFAALLAFLFLDEPITLNILLGGALMLLAAFLPQVPGRFRAHARH